MATKTTTPSTPAPLDEAEETRRGKAIAEVLQLRKVHGRYQTTWGSKTELGLFRTLQRLIMEGS
jgi:hypothetical protein